MGEVLTPEPGRDAGSIRLESWKEIAAYLGRDVRTVQRWERGQQLPVHRLLHTKRGSVFAYVSELETWRTARDRPSSGTDRSRLPASALWTCGALAVLLLALAVSVSLDGPASVDVATTTSPGVYDQYLRGLFHLKTGSRTDVEKSVQHLERSQPRTRHLPVRS